MGSFTDPALILPGAVTNTEVSATAAIAGTKLEAGWQKNVANGIAGLSASASFAGLVSTDNAAVVASGQYTGNGTQNRAMPHGLPGVPVFVFVSDTTGNGSGFHTIIDNYFRTTDSTAISATTPDATNIYVGDASFVFNLSSRVYYWVAIC